jgi:hypothetical protein
MGATNRPWTVNGNYVEGPSTDGYANILAGCSKKEIAALIVEMRAALVAWGKARSANGDKGQPPVDEDDWEGTQLEEIRRMNELAVLADRLAAEDSNA